MQGHAAANLMPVVGSNRIGTEEGDSCTVTFYGRSFVAGTTRSALLAEAGEDRETAVAATFDLDALAAPTTARRLGPVPRPPAGAATTPC